VKARDIVLVALIAIFAITTAVFLALFLQSSAENRNLKTELAGVEANLSSAQNELSMTEAELRAKNRDAERQQDEIENLTLALGNRTIEVEGLSEQLNESEAELEETKNTLSEATEDIARIREEAVAIDGQINESIQWFRNNSALPSTLKADRFMNKVEKSCENDGVLKLACITYLMENELGFSYKDDPTGDRLYSIDEIIARKGGDCEDYSLFFKALLNRMKQEDLEIEAWTGGMGEYVIYQDPSSGRYWYFENTRGVGVGNTRDSNPYAVCYFYDTGGEMRIGHCVIMLTDRTIETPEDITNANLAGSALFEPQDGHYMGKVGNEFSVCEGGDASCDFEDDALAFIITDSDLYQFNDGKWNYYEGRRVEISGLLSRLDRIDLE
jgi:Skp family chaperone for outer membrane proteins